MSDDIYSLRVNITGSDPDTPVEHGNTNNYICVEEFSGITLQSSFSYLFSFFFDDRDPLGMGSERGYFLPYVQVKKSVAIGNEGITEIARDLQSGKSKKRGFMLAGFIVGGFMLFLSISLCLYSMLIKNKEVRRRGGDRAGAYMRLRKGRRTSKNPNNRNGIEQIQDNSSSGPPV